MQSNEDSGNKQQQKQLKAYKQQLIKNIQNLTAYELLQIQNVISQLPKQQQEILNVLFKTDIDLQKSFDESYKELDILKLLFIDEQLAMKYSIQNIIERLDSPIKQCLQLYQINSETVQRATLAQYQINQRDHKKESKCQSEVKRVQKNKSHKINLSK
ncbi:Hypothetical_protein [Hexamita inflata]|uniref:Hypothetical_protein n=1 Tax=Hexamita inflata TaxID=28002 RepID=A0AA86UE27_9EUKA|nr:Hypothetical protein HINF_LOCUS39704 [Hexamita inflata]